MSDTTGLTMIVVSPDTSVLDAAAAVFDDFTTWPGGRLIGPGATLRKTGTGAVGTSYEIREALDELREHDEFAYKLWQDPVYEIPGSLHIYVPGVGYYETDCDADGDVKGRDIDGLQFTKAFHAYKG